MRRDKKTKTQNDRKMKDDEQDSEDIKTTTNELLRSKKGRNGEGGGQCYRDLLIYWTQWSIDLDVLLTQIEWLNSSATFILDDLVGIKTGIEILVMQAHWGDFNFIFLVALRYNSGNVGTTARHCLWKSSRPSSGNTFIGQRAASLLLLASLKS